MWPACRPSPERCQRARLGATSVPEHSILFGVLPCGPHSMSRETGVGVKFQPSSNWLTYSRPGNCGGCRCSSLGQSSVPNQTDKLGKEEGSREGGRDQGCPQTKEHHFILKPGLTGSRVDRAREVLGRITRSLYSSGFIWKHQPRNQI